MLYYADYFFLALIQLDIGVQRRCENGTHVTRAYIIN